MKPRVARFARDLRAFGLIVLALMLAGGAWAQADAPAPETNAIAPVSASTTDDRGPFEVALVTVSPGEIYWERFGHNGLLFRDRANGEQMLFHYGIFDFEEAHFFWNFIRGYMTYAMVGVEPTWEFDSYRAEGRGVTLQWLNLTAAQQRELLRFLSWNRQPENARYRYDYFTSNCSTKVRDALDRVLDGAIARATQSRSRGVTYRMQALRLMSPDLWLALGMGAGFGPSADRALTFWEEMFVPAELARHLDEVQNVDAQGQPMPLLAREETLAAATVPPPPAAAPDWRLPFAVIGLGLGAALAGLGRHPRVAARRVFGALAGATWLVAGLGGLVMLALWFGTEHWSSWRNANVLLFNPLCLGLLPVAWRALRGAVPGGDRARVIQWTILVCLGIVIVLFFTGVTRQALAPWIMLWAPIHLGVQRALRDQAPAANATTV